MGKRVHTMDYFRKLAKAKDGKCLSKSYISTNKKLKWMCAEGYIWYARPSHIMNGHWCPHCDGQAPLTIKDLQATAKKKRLVCIWHRIFINISCFLIQLIKYETFSMVFVL